MLTDGLKEKNQMGETQTTVAAPATDWPARFAAARELDGSEWDEAQDQLEADWCAAYAEAFIAVALARGNWTREDAETWPPEIAREAFSTAADHGYCPCATAEHDVPECEDSNE